MSRRSSRGGAVMWSLTVAAVVVGLAISIGRDSVMDLVLYAILPLNLATVGALVLSRDGTHRIGWAFSILGLYVALAEIAQGYGYLAADLSLPGGNVGSWFIAWSWVGEMATYAVIAAIFPNGRLAAPRWRWVLWCAGAGAVLTVLGMSFGRTSGAAFEGGVNPYLVDHPSIEVIFVLGVALLTVALLGGAGSPVLRLRRARGLEREQLKWFVSAIAMLAVVAPFVVALWLVTPFMAVVIGIAVNALPIAAGIAILRYRLYDIDLVIKRTIVYTALTAILVSTYVLLVLLLQALLRPWAGESDLAVAVSTLGVAALFRPLRAAIQSVVDQRFFRGRYDAAQTLGDFSERLRHELDLEALGSDLRVVVDDAMQPAHVSLWLRDHRSSR